MVIAKAPGLPEQPVLRRVSVPRQGLPEQPQRGASMLQPPAEVMHRFAGQRARLRQREGPREIAGKVFFNNDQSPVGAMRKSWTPLFFSSVTASRPAPERSVARITIA